MMMKSLLSTAFGLFFVTLNLTNKVHRLLSDVEHRVDLVAFDAPPSTAATQAPIPPPIATEVVVTSAAENPPPSSSPTFPSLPSSSSSPVVRYYVCVMTADSPLLQYNNQTKDDCCLRDNDCLPFQGSTKLSKNPYPHGPNTTWLIRTIKGIPSDLPTALKETLQVRFQRHGYTYTNNNNNKDTLSLVNRILEKDGFALVFVDSNDLGRHHKLKLYLRRTIKPLVGYQQTYLITRSTTSSPYRNMERYNTLPYNTTFTDLDLGGVTNFSATGWTDNVVRGVKHYTYPIREELLQQVESTFQQQQQPQKTATTPTTTINSSSTSLQQQPVNDNDPMVQSVGRTKDVASFWNPNDTSYSSNLRTAVSTAVQQVASSHNWQYVTDIVGYRDAEGRQKIHPRYVQALLDYKIVVVCQRDHYEDQIRLFEAIVGGALVLTDPMHDFPSPGLVDGETLVVYRSLQDLQHKLEYYLETPQGQQERMQIATRARRLALQHHRSWHRWESLLLGDWSIRDDNSISILD